MLAIGATGCISHAQSQPAGSDGNEIVVTLLHVNDLHGHTEPYSQLLGKSVGGYARLATLTDQIRSTSKSAAVYLIHAGDEFSRGDELTTNTRGAANIALMNQLRFNFWTPGNGDFYDMGGRNGMDNLRQRIAEANFHVLTSNVTFHDTGNCLAEPFVIEQAGGAKIAFFGLCTVYKNNRSSTAGRLAVAEFSDTAAALVPQLRAKADVVVAVTHIGYAADKILAGGVSGIDVIIGGHSHTKIDNGEVVKDPGGQAVLVCQTGEYMQYLGQVDLTLARAGAGYHIVRAQAKLIPIDDTVKLDPAVTATIARLAEAAPKAPVAKKPAEKEPAEKAPAAAR